MGRYLKASKLNGKIIEDFIFDNNILSTVEIDQDMILDPNGDGSVQILGTESLLLPGGTTAEQPSSPVLGMIRFNSDANIAEFYNGTSWIDLTAGGGGGSVNTVFGRIGTVVSASGDYTASQITNVPLGNISSITVQAAINELDNEKVPATRNITTGVGIVGGGTLSADRTFNLDLNTLSTDATGGVVTDYLAFVDADGGNLTEKVLISDVITNAGLATTAGVETFTNKIFEDSTTTFIDDGDNTKIFKFEASLISTGTTRTLTVPDEDGTILTTGNISNNEIAELTALDLLGNGIVTKTGDAVYANRQIVGTTGQTTVLNGDGATGNPQIGFFDNPVFPGTGSITLPRGTTGQAPGSPVNGMLRYDISTEKLRVRENGAWVDVVGTSTVSSVFTRTGAVVATSGDYTADLVDYAPTGQLIATDVEAAINELEVEKVSVTFQQTVSNKAFIDNSLNIIDNLDNTKQVQFQASALTTGTTRTYTWPDASGTVALAGITVPTSRILTAGDGLSGGGDLTADRTFDLDLNELTTDATGGASGDFLVFVDISDANNSQKVLVSNFITNAGILSTTDIPATEQAELLAIDALAAGMVAKTADATYAARTITGTTNQIGVTNGDGVSGEPTLAISDNAVLPGTIALTLPIGNTAQETGVTDGMIRYNSQTAKFRARENGSWINLVGGGGGSGEDLIGTVEGTTIVDGIEVGAAAVNYFEITNANAASAPRITAVGTDTDIDFEVFPKGTGKFKIIGAAGNGIIGVAGTNNALDISGSNAAGAVTLTVKNIDDPATTEVTQSNAIEFELRQTSNSGGAYNDTVAGQILLGKEGDFFNAAGTGDNDSFMAFSTMLDGSLVEQLRISSANNELVIPIGNNAAETGTTDGAVRYDSQSGKFRGREGGAWVDLISAGSPSLAGLTDTNITSPVAGALIIWDTTPGEWVDATLTATASETTVLNADGSITIGIADNPILPGTSGVVLPTGTTGQETGTTNGEVRYNSTTNKFRGRENGSWVDIISAGGGATLSSLTDTNVSTPADGALLIYDTTPGEWVDNTLTGTANQVDITNAEASITLSLPSIIILPNTADLAISVADEGATTTAGQNVTITAGAGGSATTGGAGGNITLTAGDADGSGANDGGDITLSPGVDTAAGNPGTVNFLDAADNTKIATFDLTGITTATTRTMTIPDASGTLVLETRTVTAGVGLSGGGDLSADITLTVDLNELVTDATGGASGDFLAFVDITDTNASNKVLVSDFITNAGLVTATDIPATEQSELAAIDALAAGMVAKTADATYAARTITGTANAIAVTNGDGISGNPTLDLSDNPILSGTSGVVLPTGTTGEEVGTTNGEVRYNSTTNKFRGRENGSWVDIISAGGGTTLTSLTDTNITTPAAGSFIVWDTTPGEWVDALLTGTANQIDVTNADGSVTLSLPNTITLPNTADLLLSVADEGATTTAGQNVTITAGAGGSATTGGAGGSINITAGDADGSGANDGGDVNLTPGVDTAAGNPGTVNFLDAADNTKIAAFDLTGITTATTRTLTVPDASGTIALVATTVPDTRTVTAGVGLSGGGALSGNITLTVDLNELVTDATGGASGDFLAFVDITDANASNKVLVSDFITNAAILPLAGGTLTGALTLDADPSSALHAATKQYVDAAATGLDVKDSVRAATTADVATLSGGAPDTLDGVSLAANDRILVKNQSTGNQNGIYEVTTLGTGANGTWTRTTDADEDAEVTAGLFVLVTEGTLYSATGWLITTNDPITVDTTAIVFAQFSAQGDVPSSRTLTAGNGLSGGGTLSADRTFDLDLNELTTDATGGATTDYLVFTDTSEANASQKVLVSSFITNAGLVTATDIPATEQAELLAIDALAAGMVAKTADATYAARTITGTASEVDVTNGDGISGNPTIGLPASVLITTDLGVGTATTDATLHAEADSAATAAVTQLLRITSTSTGTPAVGIGVGMEFEVETAAANNEIGATIEAETTNVGAGTEAFDLTLNLMTAGAAAAERMRMSSESVLTLTAATTVTPTLAVAGVDTNIDLGLQVKGTGGIQILGSSGDGKIDVTGANNIFGISGSVAAGNTVVQIRNDDEPATTETTQGSVLNFVLQQTSDSGTGYSDAIAGQLAIIKEADFFNAAGTADNDAAMAFSTMLDGVLVEQMRITSAEIQFKDQADNTKIAAFDVSGITTATTRTFTFPDASGTLLTDAAIPTTEQAELAAIDALGNGMVAKTADATYAARTITGTTNLIDITNGDGIAGNPTITVGANVLTTTDIPASEQTELAAIDALAAGIVAKTGDGTYSNRTLTGTANEVVITNGDGIAGNPTFGIADNPILTGTSGVVLPTGTTGEEVGTTNGEIRYNSTTGKFRGREGGAWVDIISAGGGSTLTSLTDTNITTPAAGSLIIWDTTPGEWVDATLTGTANQIDVTNADGSVTLSIPNTITLPNTADLLLSVADEGATTTAGQNVTITAGAGGSATTGGAGGSINITAGDSGGSGANDGGDINLTPGVDTAAGNPGTVNFLDAADNTKIAAFDLTGITTATTRTYTFPDATGTLLTDADIPTTEQAELAAIDALGNGYVAKTADATYAARTITGTSGVITVSNGDGSTGNPVIDIADNPTLSGTGSVLLPKGTTAQEPGSPVTGELRYNTSDNTIEWWNNSAWAQPGVAGGEANQFAFSFVAGDTGTANAESTTDTITIRGGVNGGIVTLGSNTDDSLEIDLDIADLAAATSVAADELAFNDITDGISKKTTITNFIGDNTIVQEAIQIATSATSGLSGGGDLSVTRNIVVAPALATGGTVAALDEILAADVGTGDALIKVTAQSIADLADSKVRRATVALAASTNIGAVLPANAYVTRVIVNIGTAYDNSSVMTVSAAGGLTALAVAADIDPQTIGVYVITLGVTAASTGQITAGLTLSPTVGASTVTVEYIIA